MKKAFTMVEFIFVIVVIGVLATIIIPKTKTNPLQEAAVQVLSHIRYTQHLAMIDDKYNTSNTEWFRERWQIFFSNTTNGSNDKWAYSIFSDKAGGNTGNPDVSEIAINPLAKSKLLTGGYSGTVQYDDIQGRNTKELHIGEKYGIVDIDFIDGCSIAINKQRIFFDYLGRPFYGGAHLQTKAYNDESSVKLLKSKCHIELCLSTCTSALSTDKITIELQAETGYSCILDSHSNCI